MLTIAPPPLSRMIGATSCVIRNGPVRFTASTRCHSSSVTSSSGLNTAMPALLTSASMRPKRSCACRTAFCTESASETSASTASASSARSSAFTVARTSSPRTSSSATCQPSSRKRFAAASPMPRAAPVIRATLLLSIVMMNSTREHDGLSYFLLGITGNNLPALKIISGYCNTVEKGGLARSETPE